MARLVDLSTHRGRRFGVQTSSFCGNPAKHGKFLTKDRRKRLGLDAPLPTKQHDLMLETIDAGHCRLVPKQHLEPMIAIQRARDANHNNR